MTENEIFKMEAGYELNVLVATRVMGKKFPTVEEMRSEAQRQWRVQPECRHFLMGFDAWLEEGEFKWRYNVDAYSTDISHAWKAVEKMQTMDFDFSIYSTDDSGEASFFKAENVRAVECDGKNVQEAICKCALLVVLELAQSATGSTESA